MAYVLGGPIALVVGLFVASVIWKQGQIQLWKTAAVAFLVPTASLALFFGGAGLLFGVLYGLSALLSAVTLQLAGTAVARRFFGLVA